MMFIIYVQQFLFFFFSIFFKLLNLFFIIPIGFGQIINNFLMFFIYAQQFLFFFINFLFKLFDLFFLFFVGFGQIVYNDLIFFIYTFLFLLQKHKLLISFIDSLFLIRNSLIKTYLFLSQTSNLHLFLLNIVLLFLDNFFLIIHFLLICDKHKRYFLRLLHKFFICLFEFIY